MNKTLYFTVNIKNSQLFSWYEYIDKSFRDICKFVKGFNIVTAYFIQILLNIFEFALR